MGHVANAGGWGASRVLLAVATGGLLSACGSATGLLAGEISTEGPDGAPEASVDAGHESSAPDASQDVVEPQDAVEMQDVVEQQDAEEVDAPADAVEEAPPCTTLDVFKPSHADASTMMPCAGDLSSGITAIDTSSLTLTGGSVPPGGAFVGVGLDAILSIGGWTVTRNVSVSGTRRLIVVAAGAVSVGARIFASAVLRTPGPGGYPANQGPGVGGNILNSLIVQDQGGGGAGFLTNGANGGPAPPATTLLGGTAYGALLTDWNGGSGGGTGSGSDACPGAFGGGGGGALQITSNVSVIVTGAGAVEVNGGGGTGGCTLPSEGIGGGGGGSGGEAFPRGAHRSGLGRGLRKRRGRRGRRERQHRSRRQRRGWQQQPAPRERGRHCRHGRRGRERWDAGLPHAGRSGHGQRRRRRLRGPHLATDTPDARDDHRDREPERRHGHDALTPTHTAMPALPEPPLAGQSRHAHERWPAALETPARRSRATMCLASRPTPEKRPDPHLKSQGKPMK